MEESVGAQYAVQIAVHTLRDRCHNLQKRVALLEEENLKLTLQCNRYEKQENSLEEVDKLRQQIFKLSEQKQQLMNKVKLVTTENKELWDKLGRLTRINQNLGSHLNKIHDSLTQHTTKEHLPLIRSRTFTQDEPHTKVLRKNLAENSEISLELENISLKLINSFAKEKLELEAMYQDIPELQDGENITDSFGFCYDDEFCVNLVEEFKTLLEELKITKGVVTSQKEALQKAVQFIIKLQERKNCENCDKSKVETSNKSTSTINEESKINIDPKMETPTQTNQEDTSLLDQMEKICPICSRNFRDKTFPRFQIHVEGHFLTTDNSETPFEAL